jgi:hypothetical protein
MFQTMLSNIFMIGFYLYFFNKFCAEYIKTHFSKSMLCVLYLIVMYKIMSVDYIIKNLIIISFIGIISYENDYINKKIGYFDNNELIIKIQKYVITMYDKISGYLHFVFIFYEKIVMYFKKDLLKLSGDIDSIENTDNEEMEIMLNKMKEMLNDINMDMNNIEKSKKKNKLSTVDNNVISENNTRIDDDEQVKETPIKKDIDMEEMLNSIISDMKPLLNSNLFNSEFINNTLTSDTLLVNNEENNIAEEKNKNKEILEDLEDYLN